VLGVIFRLLLEERLEVSLLLAGNCVLAGLIVLAAQVMGPPLSHATLFVSDPASALGHGCLLLCLLLLLSPVLHTLTRAVSPDTVWALAIVLSAVHMAGFDYAASHQEARAAMVATTTCAKPERVPGKASPGSDDEPDVMPVSAPAIGGALSLNAAMLAAVLLASRLPGSGSVFALLTVAGQCFTVLPLCCARLRAASRAVHGAVSLALFALALSALLLCNSSPTAGIAFVVISGVVVFVAPVMLLCMQRHKAQIQGPWDIAEVSETKRPEHQ